MSSKLSGGNRNALMKLVMNQDMLFSMQKRLRIIRLNGLCELRLAAGKMRPCLKKQKLI
jgi:hypothetical protein